MAAAIVKPGDVLLLTVDANVDADSAERLRAFMLERLPELGGVIVLAGVEVAGVFRGADG